MVLDRFILTPLQADMLHYIIMAPEETVSGYALQSEHMNRDAYPTRIHQLWKRKLIVDLQPKLSRDLIGITLAGRWALFVFEKQLLEERRKGVSMWEIPFPQYMRSRF